jgi:hypothetical protein
MTKEQRQAIIEIRDVFKKYEIDIHSDDPFCGVEIYMKCGDDQSDGLYIPSSVQELNDMIDKDVQLEWDKFNMQNKS